MTKCCLVCYKISSLSNSDQELYESKIVTEVKGSTITVLFEDYGINLVHSLGGYAGVEQTISFARILVGKLIILGQTRLEMSKGIRFSLKGTVTSHFIMISQVAC